MWELVAVDSSVMPDKRRRYPDNEKEQDKIKSNLRLIEDEEKNRDNDDNNPSIKTTNRGLLYFVFYLFIYLHTF